MGQSRGGSYRKYSDKFKAGALELLAASTRDTNEGRLKEVASHLNMPFRTLQTWSREGVKETDPVAKAEIDELRAETKAELTDMFEAEMRAIFGEMAKARDEASYRDLGIVLGILTDKRQLLTGGPTSNNRLSGDPNSPIEIKAVDYRHAIASLAPGPMEDSESSGQD